MQTVYLSYVCCPTQAKSCLGNHHTLVINNLLYLGRVKIDSLPMSFYHKMALDNVLAGWNIQPERDITLVWDD